MTFSIKRLSNKNSFQQPLLPIRPTSEIIFDPTSGKRNGRSCKDMSMVPAWISLSHSQGSTGFLESAVKMESKFPSSAIKRDIPTWDRNSICMKRREIGFPNNLSSSLKSTPTLNSPCSANSSESPKRNAISLSTICQNCSVNLTFLAKFAKSYSILQTSTSKIQNGRP